jgi:hypothetical protein
MSYKNGYTNAEKEAIFAQAFESGDTGRLAIAQAMVEPIRRSLEYQAVGRKTLMVDELPQGALARYERDPAVVAYKIARRGAVPDAITEGEEVLVPTFEIAAYPTIRLSEIKARRFYIVDRAQIKAKEAIQKEEDTNIFAALFAAVATRGTQTVTAANLLDMVSINTAFNLVEQHDLVAAKIVVHPNQYAAIRNFGSSQNTGTFDPATVREILTSGLFGHLFTADIHVTSRMTAGKTLVVASPETVGAFPIRQDITVLPADDPKRLRLGWVIYEDVGIVVLNDYAIALVNSN